MSAAEVDHYLEALDPPRRAALEELRRTILEVVPTAEQVISYKVPAFKLDGEIVAGFAAFKSHLSYLPFSGSVLSQMEAELDGYERTKSSLHFTAERPLPKAVVERLIALRRETHSRTESRKR
jgi:uncharacterized protein YdhG (YjbR/CyaY superfamily)